MDRGEFEISQEMYERNKDHGFLSDEDKEKVFTPAALYAYGVYYTQVYAGKDGKYYVRYEMGDTCD